MPTLGLAYRCGDTNACWGWVVALRVVLPLLSSSAALSDDLRRRRSEVDPVVRALRVLALGRGSAETVLSRRKRMNDGNDEKASSLAHVPRWIVDCTDSICLLGIWNGNQRNKVSLVRRKVAPLNRRFSFFFRYGM